MKSIRLDKFLCDMGIGTRSEVKKFIKKKQVKVNNTSSVFPEQKIIPQEDIVTFNGEVLNYVKYHYYMLNKPAGCVSAVSDAMHKTVIDFIPEGQKLGLFPVGRLDKDTEGLLILTNDGELSHRLLAPGKHVDKTYYAKVAGVVTDREIDIFSKGLDIGEKKITLPAKLEILKSDDISEVNITICEGKFHQIKRMFNAVGMEVIYLKRIQMSNLSLDQSLAPGEYKILTEKELELLKGQ